MKQVFYPAEAG